MKTRKKFPAVSLFSGALGLDLGLERAGFETRVAVECNAHAVATIEANRRDLIPVIPRRIEKVSTEKILDRAGLRIGEPTVVTGGPCCQAFSTAGHRESMGDPRGTLFREFVRVVREARPRFFVMENVRGILSAAVKHRPLAERGPGYPELEPDEELGSALSLILGEFKALGYAVVFDVLNAADFGVPQARERVVFIGSRDAERVDMPTPTHCDSPSVDLFGTGLPPWRTIAQAFENLDDPEPVFRPLTPAKAGYMALVPSGGNWRALPPGLQAQALGGAHVSWGGRSGFFRRLAWDRPAPSLTTRPDSKATMMCHPTENRPLSIAECKRLQGFPDDWKFSGGLANQYQQIGNAVPLGLGRAVGASLREAISRNKPGSAVGPIHCPNAGLINRLLGRPRTILNPARMRTDPSVAAARDWMGDRGRGRLQALRTLLS